MCRWLLTVIACLVCLSVAALAAEDWQDPFGFNDEDYSQWGITSAPYPYDPAEQGEPNNYGCFPVGNGMVFAHLGVDEDFNTLRGITGQGHQTRSKDGAASYWQEGNWPDIRVELMDAGGRSVRWSTQSIQQLRGAALVRVIQRDHVYDMFSLAYAVPGQPLLVREFVAFGPGGNQDALHLNIHVVGLDNSGEWPVLNRGEQTLALVSGQISAEPGEDDSVVLIGQTADFGGQPCQRFTLCLWCGEGNDIPDNDALDAGTLRRQSYEWWDTWSSQNVSFDSGDSLLDDLMMQLPVIIETQRDSYSGGCAPMVSYHGYWVRDSNGPILTYLANGRFAEVMRMLRYHRAACLQLGFCHMLVPLDLDLSDLPGWQPDVGTGPYGLTAGDLSAIGTAPEDWEDVGVEHAEVPSLIVLQHYLLWRAMHVEDRGSEAEAFISEAWPFISHNLFTMQFDATHGVKFHGDETYTHGSLYSTYDRAESGQIGYPNGYIPTDFYSFDNTLLHRAAAGALAEMGRGLGFEDTEAKATGLAAQLDGIISTQFIGDENIFPSISPITGQTWLPSYCHINLRPYWLNLPCGELPREQNYLTVSKRLWHLPYPATTPFSAYMTGHSLGYWLSAAAWFEQEHLAEPLFAAVNTADARRMLLETASPEGAWCEVLSPDGLPVDIYGRTNRIRPWESGVNYYALVDYLQRGLPAPLDMQYDGSMRAGYINVEQPPPGTQLLVLTIRPDYVRFVEQDERLRSLTPDEMTAWDAGLPFSPWDLQGALIGREPQTGERIAAIPYLFLDRDVRGGFDRRTFKDEEFWFGDDMRQILADYTAAGGTVIDEDSLELRLAEDEVVALKLLVVLCTHTFTHEMTAEERATFHQEMAEWVQWYDAVAGDRLRLELDLLEIGQRLSPKMCGPEGEDVYWMDYDDVEGLLGDRGIADNIYDSVCCFYSWDRDFEMADGNKAGQAYGGAAQGPADDMEFLGRAGRTSYFGSAVLISHPDRTSKNATHEYLHNVDAMFELVGDERLFHPDHMGRNMEQLLGEVPGGFERWGFSDTELRELTERAERGEAGFPWRTQLVYYQQGLQRIPREDYARLLTHFGCRAEHQPRTRLYERLILPEGTAGYQLHWVETPGAEALDVADKDFSEEQTLVWEDMLWAGAPEDAGGEVHRYAELELLSDDTVEYMIGGDEAQLSVWLGATDDGRGYGGAGVWADIDGESAEMSGTGGGVYVCRLPDGLGERATVRFRAEAVGYVCSPLLVELHVHPAWELSVRPRPRPGGSHELALGVDGPAGSYAISARVGGELNTIQQLLSRDGLLEVFSLEAETTLAPGLEALISPYLDPTFAEVYELTVAVTHTDLAGRASMFTHHFPAGRSLSALLGGRAESELPPYVARAYPRSDGTGEAEPSWQLALSPDSGSVFSGAIDGPQDASLELAFRYDDRYFYVEGTVRDEMTPIGGIWDVDRVNLVFDTLLDTTPAAYPDGPVGHNGWQKDDYWVFLAAFAEGGPLTMRLGGERPSGGKNGYYGEVAGAEAAVEPSGRGYRVEWRIPWESLPYFEPVAGQLVGFAFFLTDYDEDLSEMMYLTDWGGADGIEWRYWDCGLLYFAP